MMWRAVVVVMVAALGASSLAALPQSAVHEFAIRTQHLHIDHLEHEVDELEHELGKLSREVTPWDVNMLKGRLHRLEGTTSSPTIAYVMYTMEFCGLSSSLPSSVQNAAARVVTRSRKFDHITPVLNEFHWLPMVQRVRFKLTLIVFKCLHGLWHRPTSPTTASLCRAWLVDVRCGPSTPEPCTFHGLVLPSAPGTLQWLAHVYGTVCRLNCEC